MQPTEIQETKNGNAQKKKSDQDVQKYIDKIWSILDPEGKRRRKKYG